MRGRLGVGVVAVDDVRGHELVQQSGHDLDADEAADETAHHGEAGCLLAEPALQQVALRRGQHAVQGRKQLFGTGKNGSVSQPRGPCIYICYRVRLRKENALYGGLAHHDTEAQTQRAGQEGAAVLDAEVALAGDQAHQYVDTDDARPEDTGC